MAGCVPGEGLPGSPSIDELWIGYAGELWHTPPGTPEHGLAKKRYILSVLAKLATEAQPHDGPLTAKLAGRLIYDVATEGLAVSGATAATAQRLSRRSASWHNFAVREVLGGLMSRGDTDPETYPELLYMLAAGEVWFVDESAVPISPGVVA